MWNRPTNFFFHDLSRDSIGAQLQLALAKADSEQLARQIAEEQLSDVEKEKTMLELEIKELIFRHKTDINKKDSVISSVSDQEILALEIVYCLYVDCVMINFYISKWLPPLLLATHWLLSKRNKSVKNWHALFVSLSWIYAFYSLLSFVCVSLNISFSCHRYDLSNLLRA